MKILIGEEVVEEIEWLEDFNDYMENWETYKDFIVKEFYEDEELYQFTMKCRHINRVVRKSKIFYENTPFDFQSLKLCFSLLDEYGTRAFNEELSLSFVF